MRSLRTARAMWRSGASVHLPHLRLTSTSHHFTYHIRLASTTSFPSLSDGESPFFHKEWPQHHDPSPYDIFNMKPHEFDKKRLKKTYYQIAKLYHPDVSTNNAILSHKGDILSDEHKSERFKLLTEAYALLKDTQKKAMYDQYKAGWGRNGSNLFNSGARPSYSATTMSHDFNDHRYWNASNWEDYQNLRDMSDPALRDDKMKALGLIILFMVGGAAVQGWIFLNSMDGILMERQKIHDDCESDLMSSYLNYGLDGSRMSRIRRFLWFRTFGLYREREHLDRSAEENEHLIKEVMGAATDV